MATTSDSPTGSGDAFWWLRDWPAAMFGAPPQLNQPILPGWSFISVNEQNSSAPDTERRIVAKDSYGRQIGRLMDAVTALIAERPAGAPVIEAFVELGKLEKRVDQAKADAASDRLKQIAADLKLLKERKPAEYRRQAEALRRLLGD